MIETNETNGLPCGHPRGCLAQDAEGTAHCAWCEEVARLRASLAKQIHKRQSEVANALLARDSVDGTIAEWYDECQSETERLRELVLDAGTLNWLVKAAHRWWKDNGGEGTQKDIAAGYALVKKLHREANIGRE